MLLFVADCCLNSLPAQTTSTPKQVVETTANSVLDILRDDALATDEKRIRIQEVVYAHVDFDLVSRFVLAANWRRLTPAQQKEFVAEFKQHISSTYGKNIDDYKNETVVIEGEREEARGDRTVMTRVNRGSGEEPFIVHYRMRKRGEEWKIIDVIIENVSLVANFRSQFKDIISQGGPERLLELLKEKNSQEAAEK